MSMTGIEVIQALQAMPTDELLRFRDYLVEREKTDSRDAKIARIELERRGLDASGLE